MNDFEFPKNYVPTESDLERLRQWKESNVLRESWENFIDSNFTQFNNRIRDLMKNNIGYPCDGFPGDSLEKDVVSVTIELGKIIDAPHDGSKRELNRYKTQVGFATAKYIKLCDFWRSNGERYNSETKEFEDIDRSELTNFFLDSYRHLEGKDARRFVDLVVHNKGVHLIDDHFWGEFEQIKKNCKADNIWHFLKTFFDLSDFEDTSERLFDKKYGDLGEIQNSFTKNFIKVESKICSENVMAFCRGVKELFWMKKSNFDEYAMLAINISNEIPGQMGFWAIYDTALLEREDIDFTGNQFVNDILSVKKIFGEKATWAYMMGMVGSVKNKPTKTISELKKHLSILISELDDLSWYDQEKNDIEKSDKDPVWKRILMENLDSRLETIKHDRDFYTPQRMEDYPKIDPLLFRSMFRDIINKFGLTEAYIFSHFWKEGFDLYYYSDGSKSGFKTTLEFPELLNDFKQKVGDKVYKRAIYILGKMANLGIYTTIKLINDIMECYASMGEKITLGRIGYTYGLYYLREGYLQPSSGRIYGLEKLEGDIYKRRKAKK